MYGQDVGVAVVLKAGERLGAEELKGWVGEKLAKFKVPRKVSFFFLFSCSCWVFSHL
jgi:hypothetical protein